MNKWLIFIFIYLISCIKFEFESPYEDANGIYLQWIGSYPAAGNKVVVIGKTGYFLDNYYNRSYVEKYAVTTDSVYLISRYFVNKRVTDFEVDDDYAFLAIPDFGLEIVNFQGDEPFLYGDLQIPDQTKLIRIAGNCAYLLCDSSFLVVDIENKGNPALKSELKFDKPTRHFEVNGSRAYILFDNFLFSKMDEVFLILNIENPSLPQKVFHSCCDTIYELKMFNINKNYIFFLSEVDGVVVYKIVSDNKLVRISHLMFPPPISFIYTKDKEGIVLSGNTFYYLNLEYPSDPCISEMMNLSGTLNYGLINPPYIYLLNPYLNIVEIREIPK